MRQPIDRIQAKFRLPEALYQRLLIEAELQSRNANDEAVLRLQQSFERDDAARRCRVNAQEPSAA